MLPQLSAPTFYTTLPSTGQEIEYRPFLVKEEKVLLMAIEGGAPKEITNAVLSIVSACVQTEIDADKITTFDLEYLFLKLRGKSVGEVIDLTLGHTGETECTGKTKVALNLDDIKVQGLVGDGKIMLTDEIGVKMRYPNLTDMDKIQSSLEKDDMDSTFGIIAMCVEYIFDMNDVYSEFTTEELKDWLGNLSQGQFKTISDFFSESPKLRHELKWKCNTCGEEESLLLEGLESFFTLA